MDGRRRSGAGTIGAVAGGARQEGAPRPEWEQGPLGGFGDEEGSATAEYAIATMAAVGFAGLLVVILKGDEVRGILTELVTRALTSGG
ncbi:DUF4244 domain-containing protein [Rathayibacter sp. VKM Ac-2856]|jgi:Protein of unknown function (DUF4244)|uniref:DUF4244 domain-containing protein n=1 Tax=unclassified Rathayibacter TaxID=2609250 RepID=UPI0015668268|nr:MULTISPECIES: DUF4244 domain-containing protein [unclassified Rathayibacter]NQX06493.1 DUF4244 domain-containing protein [Rathayibacter sp. VKM Ac-2858]NQX21660.1 DUF4244 domain-containing protein [Rathayibacter sp. VKM Ac-2856]